MNTIGNRSFRSPPGTPVRTRNIQLTNNQKRNIYLNRKHHDLRDAINILRGNSNNNIFNEFNINFNRMSFDNRKGSVNPKSALFMDKSNEKVYKIGLWGSNYSMGIRNEYIAYKKISKQANSHRYLHTPKMIDCKIIPGTKYALLVITYQKALENAKLIENTEDVLYKKAEIFLENIGITHDDLLGNIYKIHLTNNNNNLSFFIIDFEDCIFINNNKFKLNNTSNTYLNNMNKNVKKLTLPPETSAKKRKPGLRLFPNTSPKTPTSPFYKFSLGNNDPYNRLGSNFPPGSPSPKSPRKGGKKNKSKKNN